MLECNRKSKTLLVKVEKQKKGFVLTEVLITVAIVGMVMIPLFGLQGSLLSKLKRSANNFVHLLHLSIITRHARNEQLPNAQTFTVQEKLEYPEVQLHYQLEKPAKESSLANLENIFVEKITMQWNEFGKQKTDHFAQIVFRPESEINE